MNRILLSTTAAIALIATSAIAGDTAAMKPETDAASGASGGVYEFEFHTLAPTQTTGFLASNMIGKSVLTGEADDAATIGDINDVIIGRDGSVRAVIVGVGGFLGIGEKEVAVEMERLTLSPAAPTSSASSATCPAANWNRRPTSSARTTFPTG